MPGVPSNNLPSEINSIQNAAVYTPSAPSISDISTSESSSYCESEEEINKKKNLLKRKKNDNTEYGEIDSDFNGKKKKLLKKKQKKTHTSTEISKPNTEEFIDIRLNQIRKLTEKTNKEHDKVQHKLDKIERAYLKAQQEDNKINVKKCYKYKMKYSLKVNKLKGNLKILQSKRDKLQNDLTNIKNKSSFANNCLNLCNYSKEDSKETKSSKQVDLQNDLLNKNIFKTNIESMEKSLEIKSTIKLPFPVLHDLRDMSTIYGTLETKRIELIKKIEQNIHNLNIIRKEKNSEKWSDRIEKLKQFELIYDLQRDKIEKQLEYVKLSMNLENIRSISTNNPSIMMQNKLAIDQMTSQLNDMYTFMKQENKLHLKRQQEAQLQTFQQEEISNNNYVSNNFY